MCSMMCPLCVRVLGLSRIARAPCPRVRKYGPCYDINVQPELPSRQGCPRTRGLIMSCNDDRIWSEAGGDTGAGGCISNSDAIRLNPREPSYTMEKSDERTEVVLLATGSYNPITVMHLRLFELARDYLNSTGNYKVVKGIISPVSDGYKKKGLVEGQHRLSMAQLATQTSDWIKVDPWECLKQDWTDTVAVLRHHQQLVGTNNAENLNKKSGCRKSNKRKRDSNCQDVPDHKCLESRDAPQVKLLCGADMLESLGTPNLWKPEHIVEIVSSFGLVCITRIGNDPRKFIYESDILWKYRHNIHLVEEWITNDISSTKVRRALRRGMSIRYLVPDLVLDYIKNHDLYSEESEEKNSGLTLEPLVRNTKNLQ
ncbi:PREDICTED: nicotinamide/nicotinic acid mononucleotide adenylyltransferase 1 [Nanorana parkeri]|uniref:nicotinamide/nicotinic acid mononucleotide adenylyltransferase 1 n=1 Tax=Nanorana parkeri TaxID=125878 RepID=UPI000854B1FD|nr:PREDICTED: nicotinamide/nicotinic acid mononucleotide adenylyltransferase 1 [Nanorana parkeri]